MSEQEKLETPAQEAVNSEIKEVKDSDEAKGAKDSKEAKKQKAAAKKEKRTDKIKRWFKDLRGELKKVTWPTLKDTLKNVGVVIACVLVVGVFIWAFDWLARAVVSALLNLASLFG